MVEDAYVQLIDSLFTHIMNFYKSAPLRKEVRTIFSLIFENQLETERDVLGEMELFSDTIAGYATRIIDPHKKSKLKRLKLKDPSDVYNKISVLLNEYDSLIRWSVTNVSKYPLLSQYISLNVSLVVMMMEYIKNCLLPKHDTI